VSAYDGELGVRPLLPGHTRELLSFRDDLMRTPLNSASDVEVARDAPQHAKRQQSARHWLRAAMRDGGPL